MSGESKNFIGGNQSNEAKNVLVISDLADNVNEQDLNIFFEQFKESIIVIQNNRSKSDFIGGKSNSATVVFREYKQAEKAKYELNMKKLKGKTVRITWHERDSTLRYNNQVNLYIKNIPLNVTPREFYVYFSTFGEVVSAKLVENEEGNHLGYGYVHYASSEAKNKCLEASNNKEVWPGSALVVENFQKKQERTNETLNPNKSIFMKNFPNHYDEKKLKELLGGVKIVWLKMMTDPKNRKYAIIILDSEEDVNKVKELNKREIEGQELFVDNLMNKHDRKRYLSSKIYDQNTQLTKKYRDCNLHVRNLPQDFTEDDLRNLFSQYGEIKSVKIPRTTTVTKIKGEFVEIESSACYGFVCFTSSDFAKEAIDDMTGKLLDGAKRPLIISHFMPKYERNQTLNSAFQKKNMIVDGFGMGMSGMNLNAPYMGDVMYGKQSHFRQYPTVPVTNNVVTNTQKPVVSPIVLTNPIKEEKKSDDEPNYELLKSMEDDTSKRDYLGEFIFRKIENHNYSESNNLTLDIIGKITGMILGIEDVNEIIDICRNSDHLSSRIMEALNLLMSN
jgi:RNA recognition motif-containing protein